MQAGTVDVTTVLQAETTLFSDEDILVQVRLARFQALLSLYKALGGGWIDPGGRSRTSFRPPTGPAAGRRGPAGGRQHSLMHRGSLWIP